MFSSSHLKGIKKGNQMHALKKQADEKKQGIEDKANNKAKKESEENALIRNARSEENYGKISAHRRNAEKEGRAYANEFIGPGGMDPKEYKALQYEAHRGIHRNEQAANRKLLGEQGKRGIIGHGGVGYAQQRELQRAAQEQRGQANRDLTKLDTDIAAKNKAARGALELGYVGNSLLDRQIAEDAARYDEESERLKKNEKRASSNYSRV